MFGFNFKFSSNYLSFKRLVIILFCGAFVSSVAIIYMAGSKFLSAYSGASNNLLLAPSAVTSEKAHVHTKHKRKKHSHATR